MKALFILACLFLLGGCATKPEPVDLTNPKGSKKSVDPWAPRNADIPRFHQFGDDGFKKR